MNRPTPAHHGAMPPPLLGTRQLARYSTAPVSFLAALADSVTRDGGDPAPVPPPPASRFYSGESSSLNSSGGSGRPLERTNGVPGEIRMPPPSPPPASRFYSGESSGLTSEQAYGGRPLQRAYGGSREIRKTPPPPPHQQQALAPPRPSNVHHGGAQGKRPAVSRLTRHSSSPAGLLSRLMADGDPHGEFGR